MVLETLYCDWLGNETLSSLCPPCFWFRINSMLCVLVFALIFISALIVLEHKFVVILWAPCSESILSCLVQNPRDSRARLIWRSWAFHKTPLLLRFPSIPLYSWGISLKSFGDVSSKSSSSSLQNLSSFRLDLILQSSSFPKVAGWKSSSALGKNFPYHRLNRRSSMDQPVCS